MVYSEGIGGDHDHHGNVERQKAEIGENWYFLNYSWRMHHLPKMRKVSLFISQVTVSGMRFCMSNKARTWWWWSAPVENFQIHKSFLMARIFLGKNVCCITGIGEASSMPRPHVRATWKCFFFSLDVTHAFPFKVFFKNTFKKRPILGTSWRTFFWFPLLSPVFVKEIFQHALYSFSRNLEKLI